MQRSAALTSYLLRRASDNKTTTSSGEVVDTEKVRSVKKSSLSCLPAWCVDLKIYTSHAIVIWFKNALEDESAQACRLCPDDVIIRKKSTETVETLATNNYWKYDASMYFNPFADNAKLLFNISLLNSNQGIFDKPIYVFPEFQSWADRASQPWQNLQLASLNIKHITFHQEFIHVEYITPMKVRLRQMLKEKVPDSPETDHQFYIFELRIGDLAQNSRTSTVK